MRLLSIRHIQLSHLLCQKSLIHRTHLKNHSIPSCNEVNLFSGFCLAVLILYSSRFDAGNYPCMSATWIQCCHKYRFVIVKHVLFCKGRQ